MKRYDYLFDVTAILGTVAQTKEIFQIVSLGITILSVLASLAFTVFRWYKSAKKDGKISIDDISELIDELKRDEK